MDKAEHAKLARQVGRMSYEQAQQLLDEIDEKRKEHWENHCEQCVWRKEYRCDPCTVHKAMGDDWLAKRGAYSALSGNDRMFAIMQIHRLEKACPNCVRREWDVFESCEYDRELDEKFYIYMHRITYLERKENMHRFEQVHGRPPASKLEFVEWLCEKDAALPTA